VPFRETPHLLCFSLFGEERERVGVRVVEKGCPPEADQGLGGVPPDSKSPFLARKGVRGMVEKRILGQPGLG